MPDRLAPSTLAFSDEVQSRDALHILERNTFEELDIPADQFRRERQRVIDRNLALFGTGNSPVLVVIGVAFAIFGLVQLIRAVRRGD